MVTQDWTSTGTYEIELHKHRFAAWAASRAASVSPSRFKVEAGRAILEHCGFTANLARPGQLPEPSAVDEEHRRWRSEVVDCAKSRGLTFTHGVAAKLINIYLKSRFVCGGFHADERVRNLHPPIDRVLLDTLAKQDIAGERAEWRKAASAGWSKFGSGEYENVIRLIRISMAGEALWMVEEHWRGNQ
ncbi:MAG: hypothetical protein AB7J35_21230 [Dehalococcoidia bacterium]